MKVKKFNVPFAQIPNNILFSDKISLKAKGLWSYIQAKPDNWQFSSERIANDCAEGLFAVRQGLKELVDNGLLVQKRLSNGRILYHLKATVQKLHREKTAQSKNLPHNKERDIINKDNNKDVAETSSAFVWKEWLNELHNSDRRDLQVIALFFDEKKLSFDTKQKADSALRRHLKPAKEVSKFDDDEILKAIDKLKRDFPAYTIETIYKTLTK